MKQIDIDLKYSERVIEDILDLLREQYNIEIKRLDLEESGKVNIITNLHEID